MYKTGVHEKKKINLVVVINSGLTKTAFRMPGKQGKKEVVTQLTVMLLFFWVAS